jgi:serine/threonine-protein kinase
VKLLDFGIAKINSSSVETETGVIKGKVRYMAPEQITGEAIDRRTDIYSCGVMLWEAATGTKLWRGVGDTVVMSRVLAGEIPAPSSVRPCDQALERVIMKALSVERGSRHATAEELLSDLTRTVPGIRGMDETRSGDYVRSLFAEDLRETRENIAARLQDEAVAEQNAKLTFPLSLVFNDSAPARSRTIRVSARWLLYGLLLTVSIALTSLVWLRGEASQAAPIQAPAKAATAPSQVSLQLTAFPAEARIFLDGEPLGSNPATAEVDPRSSHRVRAEAPGYRSVERTVQSETALVLSLEKLAEPPVPSRAEKPHPPASAHRLTTSAPAAASAPNCEPPYFYDARGVKKYKPDCL